MHLHLRPRFSTGVLLSLLLTLIVASAVTGQERNSLQRPELGLEIYLPDETLPRLRLAGPYGGGGMTLILRRSLRINDPTAAGEFTAIDVNAQSDGEAMKVTLSLVYNDLSNQEWWKNKKEKPIGTYTIGAGESIRPAELADFGIEPFELKLISAKPIVLKPGEGPTIINKTSALEVARLEKHLDSYLITVKNISSKNIVAYTIWTGNTGSGSQGTVGTPVIAAGAISHEDHLQTSYVERYGITISDVVLTMERSKAIPNEQRSFLLEKKV